MDLSCSHIIINSSDYAQSRDFYVAKLGFKPLEEFPKSVSLAAGHLRITLNGNGEKLQDEHPTNTTLIFRTSDIAGTVSELTARGVVFLSGIMEAPGFMRFIALVDPDNNPLMIAQYLKEPV